LGVGYKTLEESTMENNIKSCINDFLKKRNADDRYASFDYCYNYFYKNTELLVDVEKSCLVLCFYLASWGMFRGSSFILRKSAVYFKPLIEYIDKLAKKDQSLWDIDVDKYDDENIKKILDARDEIKKCIIREREHADKTLTGKIMLGVFGCIPAFDRYFCDTLKKETKGCGFTRIDEKSLHAIKEFYEKTKG
jgi:hypothetical protein